MATKNLQTTTVNIAAMPQPRRQHGVYYKLYLELKELAEDAAGKLVEFPSQKAGQRAIDMMRVAATAEGCVVRYNLHTDRVSRFIWVELPDRPDAPEPAMLPAATPKAPAPRPILTNDGLKPCPFCGSAARWAATTEADDFEIGCSNAECAVLVMACGANERDAATRWNTRARA